MGPKEADIVDNYLFANNLELAEHPIAQSRHWVQQFLADLDLLFYKKIVLALIVVLTVIETFSQLVSLLRTNSLTTLIGGQ